MGKKKEPTNNNIETLTEFLFEKTQTWAKKNGFNKKEEKQDYKCSVKATEVSRILDKHSFSGHDSAVRELMEAIIEEKLPSAKKEVLVLARPIEYEVGIIIVPLSDPNSHGYPIGEPLLLITKEGSGFNAKGTPRTTMLPHDSLTAIRPATKNEIQQFFEDVDNSKDKNLRLILAALFLNKGM